MILQNLKSKNRLISSDYRLWASKGYLCDWSHPNIEPFNEIISFGILFLFWISLPCILVIHNPQE